MDKFMFCEKVDRLISTFPEHLKKEALRLYDSGAIDPTNYQNNHLLVKAILCVALEKLASDFRPRSPEGKEAVANLRHF